MISPKALAEYEERKLAGMGAPRLFRYFAMKLLDAEYVMGKENIFETDCSGTICWPLFCMGLNIRVRAEYLYNHMYIHHLREAQNYYHRVSAVFYGERGAITHVSPIVGRGVILDAVNPEQPVQLKALAPVVGWYQDNGFVIHYREIDWTAALKVAEMTEYSWEREADAMLKELMR
jgi:hypothetical protein